MRNGEVFVLCSNKILHFFVIFAHQVHIAQSCANTEKYVMAYLSGGPKSCYHGHVLFSHKSLIKVSQNRRCQSVIESVAHIARNRVEC